MDLRTLETMDASGLREYIRFVLWHYRVVDAFWFLRVADAHGRAEAERINEEVWERVSGMAAKDLLERFDVKDGGLEGFARALEFFPWTILVGYEIERTADEVTITVPSCPTQEARRRRGLEEYACREMHRLEYEAFARVIDPRIVVRCEIAPPDERPAGLDCRWHFNMAASDGGEDPGGSGERSGANGG